MASEPEPEPGRGGARAAAWPVLTVLGLVAAADAAFETWRAGSPLRWIVLAAAAALLAGGVAAWRGRLSSRRVAMASALALPGLAAAASWRAGTLENALLQVAGLRGSALAYGLYASALALAAFTLYPLSWIPERHRTRARLGLALLVAWALLPFAAGLVQGASFSASFANRGVLVGIPVWLTGAYVGAAVLVPLAAIVALVATGVQAARRGRGLAAAAFRALALVLCTLMLAPDLVALRVATPASRLIRVARSSAASAVDRVGRALEAPLPEAVPPGSLDDVFAVPEGASPHLGVDALVAHYERDPARLFRHVADRIGYQAYVGVLRGPRGALWSRAGNAWDQAELLAALLGEAQFETRFVRCLLEPSRARQLVADQLATPALTEREHEAVSRSLAAAGFDAERFQDRVDVDHEQLVGALEAAGIDLRERARDALDEATEIARDHVWVQLRSDADWVDLDPAFRGGAWGASHCEPESVLAQLPDAMRHRVTVRVRLERRNGDGLSRETHLEHTRSAADWVGTSVVLLHDRPGGTGGIFGAATGERTLTPVLVVDGEEIPGTPFSWSTGGGLAALFAGEAGGDEIVAEWLETEFVAPGGGVSSVERPLFDRIGFAARAAGEVAQAPLAAPDDAWAADLWGLAVVSGEVPANLVNLRISGFDADELLRSLGDVLGAFLHAYFFNRTVLPEVLYENAAVHSYLDAPNLLIATLSQRQVGGELVEEMVLDHARASRRVLTAAPDRVPARERVLEGVLDLHVERDLAERLAAFEQGAADAPRASRNVGAVFDEARARGVDVVALRGADANLGELQVGDEARARIAAALEAGLVVVTPREAPPEAAGFWLVDPATGRTRDQMGDGRAQSVTQRPIQEARTLTLADRVRRFACALTNVALVMVLFMPVILQTSGVRIPPGLLEGANRLSCRVPRPRGGRPPAAGPPPPRPPKINPPPRPGPRPLPPARPPGTVPRLPGRQPTIPPPRPPSPPRATPPSMRPPVQRPRPIR